MDKLPTELLDLILQCNVRMSSCEKNAILNLRFVCKGFDAVLKPYIFKTLQLEFSRFLSYRRRQVLELEGSGRGEAEDLAALREKALEDVAPLTGSVYIDMMVVRDEGACTASLVQICHGKVERGLVIESPSSRGDYPDFLSVC